MHFVVAGGVLGLLMAFSLLILASKMPMVLRGHIRSHPFIADLGLTSGVVFLTSMSFGPGLTLGVGSLICGILLSFALPHI